jgi:hypothetical protein
MGAIIIYVLDHHLSSAILSLLPSTWIFQVFGLAPFFRQFNASMLAIVWMQLSARKKSLILYS